MLKSFLLFSLASLSLSSCLNSYPFFNRDDPEYGYTCEVHDKRLVPTIVRINVGEYDPEEYKHAQAQGHPNSKRAIYRISHPLRGDRNWKYAWVGHCTACTQTASRANRRR